MHPTPVVNTQQYFKVRGAICQLFWEHAVSAAQQIQRESWFGSCRRILHLLLKTGKTILKRIKQGAYCCVQTQTELHWLEIVG